jgi:hypothetical protein
MVPHDLKGGSYGARQLNNLMADDAEPSSKRRKEIETQEKLVEELRGMLDEVTRVVPLWSPSLDDGITLTMAPLWRLVPQHRGWQKELKSRWITSLSSSRRTIIAKRTVLEKCHSENPPR